MSFTDFSISDMQEFFRIVEANRKENPSQRMGQVYFNTLEGLDPQLALDIAGSDDDPFHNDERIPAFIARIMQDLTEYYQSERRIRWGYFNNRNRRA